jgi:hypothetical protein
MDNAPPPSATPHRAHQNTYAAAARLPEQPSSVYLPKRCSGRHCTCPTHLECALRRASRAPQARGRPARPATLRPTHNWPTWPALGHACPGPCACACTCTFSCPSVFSWSFWAVVPGVAPLPVASCGVAAAFRPLGRSGGLSPLWLRCVGGVVAPCFLVLLLAFGLRSGLL